MCNLQKYFLPLRKDWFICNNSAQEIQVIAQSTNAELITFNKEKLKLVLHDKTRKT